MPFVGTSLDWSYIEVKSDIHTSMNKNSVFQASVFSMLYRGHIQKSIHQEEFLLAAAYLP